MLRDVVHGWRALRRTPGFTILTVLTLALGLGATVTMFSAVSASFLKPLPVPDEARVVKIYEASPRNTRIRVALLGQEPIIHADRFGEIVARNRGADVRVFTVEAHALDWLTAA